MRHIDARTSVQAGLSAAILFAMLSAAAPAMAGKEVFVRNKVHVNIGTIGPAASSRQLAPKIVKIPIPSRTPGRQDRPPLGSGLNSLQAEPHTSGPYGSPEQR